MDKAVKITSLRWSALSAFEYNREQWYQTYILGIRQESPQLAFGSYVDDLIQTDHSFIPTLPRYPVMQHRMEVMLRKGLQLTGTADGVDFTPGNYRLADFKTGVVPWTKKRADQTGQLRMYALMIYLMTKIPPEEFRYFIHWIPTKKVESGNFEMRIDFRDNPIVPYTFETKITTADILKFINRIEFTVKEMEKYILAKS